MNPTSAAARNVLPDLAAKVCTCALMLMLSFAAHSQQEQPNTEEFARFNTIYDFLQSDPLAFTKANDQLADFKRAYPKSPYALILLGEIKRYQAIQFFTPGALDEAMVLAQQAAKMNDKIADTHILLSKIYVHRQDAHNARESANRAFTLAPKRPETLTAMGGASQQNREFTQAADWYERAANAFTNPIRKSNMYVWVYNALSDEERMPMDQRTDVPKMEAALERAIRLDPADSLKNTRYGCFFLERKGDLQQGRKFLEVALKTSKYPQEIHRCRNLADYLEWALSPDKAEARSALDAIPTRTGMSIEDAFVEAAVHPGLTSISAAMLDAKVVANLNTIGSGISRRRQGCCTALVNAAFGDNFALLKKLVEAGANIHAEDVAGRTALIYAIYSANVEMVDYLLQNGARPNIRDKYGATPLFSSVFSAQRYQIQLVRTLLKYKANPMTPTAQGPALVPFAIAMTTQTEGLTGRNGVDLLKVFIEDGHVDVNAKGADDITLLAVAVFNSEQVKYLLEHGASPWVKVQNRDIVDFYSPQLSSGHRDGRLVQLERSLQLINEARIKTPAK